MIYLSKDDCGIDQTSICKISKIVKTEFFTWIVQI